MQAIEVKEFGGPEVLNLVEKPTPEPGPGQVRIAVKAAGINYADLMARAGHYPPGPKPPFVPGMEAAGIVEALGEGVSGVSVGQRVMGFVPSGGYAEQALLGADGIISLPESLDFAEGTALLVQGLTAYYLLKEAPLAPGETVLIAAAAGGVGSLVVQMAPLLGAGAVVGLASAGKHDIVRGLGGLPVDYNASGWGARILEATGGKKIDVFLDPVADMGTEAFDALADGARWIVYGGLDAGPGLSGERVGGLIWRGMTLRGYSLYRSLEHQNSLAAFADIFGWCAAGTLKIDTGSRFPLAQARDAHEAIAARKTTGKVVLEP